MILLIFRDFNVFVRPNRFTIYAVSLSENIFGRKNTLNKYFDKFYEFEVKMLSGRTDKVDQKTSFIV